MTKVSKVLEAGRNLEKNKIGFTVMELMSSLGWGDTEKQYVQSTMFQLTKRGQAYKINNGKPVIYTLKPKAGTAEQKPEMSSPRPQVISLETLAQMDIPLEMVGEGVFRRNRELERRIYQLESELVEIKRMLDDANKRISEQTRMIEKQNQIIADQNRSRFSPRR